MRNPILQVMNAGKGTTPSCPEAKFSVGDVVRVRRLKHLKHLPDRAAVAIVVPPGFPPEYALADAGDNPRPLMITKPSRAIRYIVGFDKNPTPHLLTEQDLLPSGEEPVEINFEDAP